MSDTITTNGNIASNDVPISYEKFLEQHIQHSVEIDNLKRERENYITKDYVDLKLTNLEHSLEHKFDDKFSNIDEKFNKIDEKFVSLEHKFDDKFTKMDGKISRSMLQVVLINMTVMATFMTILFFLLQYHK